MPAKKTSAKFRDGQPLPAVASMKFWSRFKNPLPMLVFPSAESGGQSSESIDFLSRLSQVSADSATAYLLRISLEGAKPPVWRRVLTGSVSLNALHRIIQIAMGWSDSHLHSFEIRKHSVPLMEDDAEINESSISIAQLFSARIKKFQYTYDIGDSWKHQISLESSGEGLKAADYPECSSGRGACPLEDCGGLQEWIRLLSAMRDCEQPQDEGTMQMLDRMKEAGWPLSFDLAETNARLRQAFN